MCTVHGKGIKLSVGFMKCTVFTAILCKKRFNLPCYGPTERKKFRAQMIKILAAAPICSAQENIYFIGY